MNLKIFFSFLFIFFVIFLMIFYWFIPFNTTEFRQKYSYSNNNVTLQNETIQFYPNMRFSESRISYRIDQCPLNKQDEMINSFKFIEEKTILRFYPVVSGEEIYVTCDSANKIEGGLFIAGEGGPTNITNTEKFNVISHGKILLIRDSSCSKPIVGIHELLHVLGFNHSVYSENIMYPVSDCEQDIDSKTIDLINDLYSTPSYPDLAIQNVSAIMHGKYLDTNLTVKNIGLRSSIPAKIDIYADEKLIKEFSVDSLEVGSGRVLYLKNVWINKFKFDTLRFYIDYSSSELEKENNEIKLESKN